MMTLANISDVLDVLCPLHLMIGKDAKILHAGPTLKKMRVAEYIEGQNFWDLFDVRRPKSVADTEHLIAAAGKKLHLRMRTPPESELKGFLVPTTKDRFVVNLSFSISVMDAVQHYALNSADFPPTDLTIDMLYLIEAKSAAMHASRKLNQRLQGAKIAAEEQAFSDTLTGLKNRRAMDHILDRLHSWNAPYTVVSLDLDFFKAVNDTLGHAAGDHVLQTVAKVLVDETREDDAVIRLGGDEFVLILPKTTDAATVDAIMSRVIERVNAPIPFQNQCCNVSASAGSATYRPSEMITSDAVLERADIALYASKNAGRGRHTAFEPGMTVSDVAANG